MYISIGVDSSCLFEQFTQRAIEEQCRLKSDNIEREHPMQLIWIYNVLV